jgi:phage tail sheath protein FI
MPASPGICVAEMDLRTKPIKGLSTSSTVFVGFTRKGPLAIAAQPRPLTSFASFEKTYGGLTDLKFPPQINHVAHAAKAFFNEGGTQLYIARVRSPNVGTNGTLKDWQDALEVVSMLADASIVAAPGSTGLKTLGDKIQSRLIAHVETEGNYRFAVLDIPMGQTPAEAAAYRARFDSKSAAFYYPWVTVLNPAASQANPKMPKTLTLPPSGFVCGIYARTDLTAGVFKAPANQPVRGVIGLEHVITEAEQQMLNPAGVNCLRQFPGKGCLVWGARTASADPEWKYVNVRRYVLFLEQSLTAGTQWAVFEPDNETLWATIRASISNFLYQQWTAGALLGQKPEDAFFVRCDGTTMTQNDLDAGRLICLIGVALIQPAEFVIFRIEQWTAGRKSGSR